MSKTPKVTYPTTIDRIGNWNKPCCHLVAEAKGMRFYLDTFETIPQGELSASFYVKRYAGKGVSFYLLDRSATHFCSGGPVDFAAMFEESSK